MQKYIKHTRSRYAFPTYIVKSGIGGVLVPGHKGAKADVEKTIGRQLHPEVQTRKRGGNWVFLEPK